VNAKVCKIIDNKWFYPKMSGQTFEINTFVQWSTFTTIYPIYILWCAK